MEKKEVNIQLEDIIKGSDLTSRYILSILENPKEENLAETNAMDEIILQIKALGREEQSAFEFCYENLEDENDKKKCYDDYFNSQQEYVIRISKELARKCPELNVLNPDIKDMYFSVSETSEIKHNDKYR